jgi:RNA polymerase sigma factor (sigma-70 family)
MQRCSELIQSGTFLERDGNFAFLAWPQITTREAAMKTANQTCYEPQATTTAAPDAAIIPPSAPASVFESDDQTAPDGMLAWSEIYSRLCGDRDDHQAFQALQRRVARWAHRQLNSPTSLREQSDDVVADTCAAVVLGLGQAYGAETFSGFVYGHFLSARRRYLRFSRMELVPLDDLQMPAHAEVDPSVDELALLRRCLLGLTPRERQAVELRYFADVSSREIARALGVSETNARRIVFNGITHMRRSVQRIWPSGRQA